MARARADIDTAALQNRSLRMGIGAVLLLLAVAAEHGFGSLDLSTFYFLAVMAIIYVPPWESVPVVGRFARAGIASGATPTKPRLTEPPVRTAFSVP